MNIEIKYRIIGIIRNINEKNIDLNINKYFVKLLFYKQNETSIIEEFEKSLILYKTSPSGESEDNYLIEKYSST